MIYENVELTGSLQVTGSIIVPMGGDSGRTNITGSLFFNTQSNTLEIFTGESGSDWVDVFSGSGESGGGGGGAASADVEYLVVAGGGGGGDSTNATGGGGGAGGLLSSSFSSVTSGSTFTVTVGAGGAISAPSNGGAGGDSSISGDSITTVTATGGGQGSGQTSTEPAGDGGSGGGGGNGNFAAGSGTSGQGNDGGTSQSGARGAGGGGAGAAGANSTGANGAAGGNGLASSITGTSTTRAGGGGGASSSTGTGGSGGTGGGGTGESSNSGDATSGTTNTGGGGGGAFVSGAGTGGSGVVILAYNSGSIHGAGGISGDAGNGRRYHQFNSSNSFVVGSTSDFNIVTGSNLVLHVDAGDFASRGTSTWTDLSTYDNDITIQSNGEIVNYWLEGDGSGEAGQFERNGGGVATNVAHTGYGNFTGGSATNYTIEFWVRSTATGGNSTTGKTIIGRNSGDVWAAISIKSNKLAFVHYDSVWLTNSSTTSINDGSWHHCVVTNFSDETGDLWVDGTKESDGSSTALSPNSGTRYLKLDSIFRGYNGENTDGDLAQLRIYDIALTDAQITQNYNATKTNFV